MILSVVFTSGSGLLSPSPAKGSGFRAYRVEDVGFRLKDLGV